MVCYDKMRYDTTITKKIMRKNTIVHVKLHTCTTHKAELWLRNWNFNIGKEIETHRINEKSTCGCQRHITILMSVIGNL